MKNSEIKIYKTPDGKTSIEVKLEKETVWLSQKQMAELFDKDSDTIGLHLRNIYKSGELDEISTTEKYSVVRQEGKRNVKRQIKFYNLDAIISVGYRVNSKRGVLFRKWATQLLKDYLIKGYAINQQRLQKQAKQLNGLKETIKILGTTLKYKELTNDEITGLLGIISDYSYALEILDQYDCQTLKIENTSGKEIYGNGELLGNEKDNSFISSLATIYQTFDGVDLFPSVEEKAANLLYFIVKNHSFSYGNKRIEAFLFLYFLEKNGLLFTENGDKMYQNHFLKN